MALAIFLIVFFALFLMGMPISFSMILSGLSYAIVTGSDVAFFSLEIFKSTNSFVLIAIPMFILTAEVMNTTSVAERMFDFANSLVGWIPGGMGHTNVLTSVIFAGMSGSAAADVGGIGYLSYKSMVDRGFDAPFAAAVTAASSCIGPIIPPSIPVIVYTTVISSASVIYLFLGGVVPGILMGLFMMIYIYFISKKRGYPVEKRGTAKEILHALKRGILPVLTPVILLATISGGVVTVSEGAVVTVVYAVILGVFVYHQFGLKQMVQCFERTFISCGTILSFFVAGKFFSFVLSRARIPDMLSNLLLGITDNKYVILLIINLIFLLLGFFSEALVNITLFAPVFVPIAIAVGVDPSVIGVMIILNTTVGACTPPVGTLVFNIAGITKTPLDKVFKEVTPFVGVFFILILLCIFCPGIISFLPNLILK
jgi:tripartite ATP-independent transporter DctM subunit